MYAKSTEKRGQILEGAKRVFLCKGFAAASMQDIIEECGISRGGLYFHFSSVDEIFREVITGRSRTTQVMVDMLIAENTGFAQLLRDYFAYQKERLCHMEKSLLGAMVQYGLTHGAPEDVEFIGGQYQKTRQMISSILAQGAARGELAQNANVMADHILFVIEGMSIMAMTARVQEDVIDAQFGLLIEMLVCDKGGKNDNT